MRPFLNSCLALVLLTGPVSAHNDPLAWPNPILPQRADPHLTLHTDGWYYFTATVPEYDRIELRRARTLGALSTAEPKVIWRKHERGPMSHHIWAPEIHFINGKWYVYFAAGRAEDVWAIRQYVLECDAANPLEGTWREKGEIRMNWDSFTLDATTFAHRGARYLVWAQSVPERRGTSLFIAPMDTPWSITGRQVLLSQPEFAWERRGHNVNEAPAVLHRNGRLFLTYSASATDANYCLGLLTADEDADLLDPKSWRKSPEPVFKSHPPTSQYGPGHNCFTTTPDGQTDILVYHARNYERIVGEPLYNPDRATRAQVLRWNADGTPDFGVPVADTPRPADTLTIDTRAPGKPISPDLIGIFFEDINYAADGGLYAELVQNRSFEYQPTARTEWNALTAWDVVRRNGATGPVVVADAFPIHPHNPRYVVIEVQQPGGGLGLLNGGFDGIAVHAGKPCDFALWGRQLFTGNRWGNSGALDGPARFTVRLETPAGGVLAEASVAVTGRDWHRVTAVLTPTNTEPNARLVVLCHTRGGVAVDDISLFPRDTFKGRPNGLRADLAQAIADLRPRFVRFPGGCLVHGYGLGNLYRWPDTVGPVEQRRAQPNMWGYYQTMGLGYFEYFQFCKDIGAKPLPVVPAGVCCQNADHQGGTGQRGLPLDAMPAYIQEVLDLIAWANGPTNSKWGAVRAAAGHPEPFGLEYLGVGNEEHITPVFRERFQMIQDAVRARHPEITVIGTTGPFHSGPDYDAGWKLADELRVAMVDEHYYVPPRWMWENLERYDRYDRARAKVYLGEYAAHDDRRRTTLRSALAEAAFLTSLERNADVVVMASYAPLLGKRDRTQWNPNLIYFSNTNVVRTINYYVQQLFSHHAGNEYLPGTLSPATPTGPAGLRAEDGVFLGTWNTQAEFDDVQLLVNGAPVVTDDFAKPAPHWQPVAGRWTVTDGVYRQSGPDEPARSRLTVPPGATNYTLTLRARKTGGAEGFLIGFRARDHANHYWWNLGGWGNTRHAIEKHTDGVAARVGADRTGRIELNRWHDVRLEVAGDRIRCFLDNEPLHDVTDAGFATPRDFAWSAVRDTQSGDLILKLVNGSATERPLQIQLPGLPGPRSAALTVLTAADPTVANDFEQPDRVAPQTRSLNVTPEFDYAVPAHSLSVIRIPAN